MKTKLEMAHDWALQYRGLNEDEIKKIVRLSWQYAELMQAEDDKRKVSGVPDAILTKDQSGKCTHLHTTFGRGECFDCGESLRKRP